MTNEGRVGRRRTEKRLWRQKHVPLYIVVTFRRGEDAYDFRMTRMYNLLLCDLAMLMEAA